jgi:hypothetical protein
LPPKPSKRSRSFNAPRTVTGMCSTCSNAPDPTPYLTGATMAVSAALWRRSRPHRCAGSLWRHHILSTRSVAHVNGARIGPTHRRAPGGSCWRAHRGPRRHLPDRSINSEPRSWPPPQG